MKKLRDNHLQFAYLSLNRANLKGKALIRTAFRKLFKVNENWCDFYWSTSAILILFELILGLFQGRECSHEVNRTALTVAE